MHFWNVMSCDYICVTMGCSVSMTFCLLKKKFLWNCFFKGIDSQRQKDPFFAGLLQDGEQGFLAMVLWWPLPIEIRSITMKSQRGNNFTIEEENLLISAWINTSLDIILVNEQNTRHPRIEFICTSTTTSNLNRSENSLVINLWSTVQQRTNKFCGFLAQVEQLHPSDYNEQTRYR